MIPPALTPEEWAAQRVSLFGFTLEDVMLLRIAAKFWEDVDLKNSNRTAGEAYADLADRIAALLPPEG